MLTSVRAKLTGALVQDILPATFMIPDRLPLLDVDHVGDILMSLLPGDLINAHQSRGHRRIELLLCQFFQHAFVDAICCFIIQAQVPTGLLIGGNGGETVNLFGKSQRKLLSGPGDLLDSDRSVFDTANLPPGNMKEDPPPVICDSPKCSLSLFRAATLQGKVQSLSLYFYTRYLRNEFYRNAQEGLPRIF